MTNTMQLSRLPDGRVSRDGQTVTLTLHPHDGEVFDLQLSASGFGQLAVLFHGLAAKALERQEAAGTSLDPAKDEFSGFAVEDVTGLLSEDGSTIALRLKAAGINIDFGMSVEAAQELVSRLRETIDDAKQAQARTRH